MRLPDAVRAGAARLIAQRFVPAKMRGLLRRAEPYAAWRAINRLTAVAQADLLEALDGEARPLARISVVMPIFRPDPEHFSVALASLRGQLLQDWQLCLCDDGSGDPSLTRQLEALAADDDRIVVTALPRNGGISAATNAAAALATGDVLLFMDQDDILTPDCLGEFVLAFTNGPDIDIAYSDSDKIDGTGQHHAPSFKPAWSPLLLLSYMYFGHAVAMRRAVFEQIGGLKTEFDGSQDYELVLRATEVARVVHHLPRILYHWRVAPGSTAVSAAEKPDSILAGQHAVAAAVARRGIPAEVVRPDWATRANLGLFGLRFIDVPDHVTLIVMIQEHMPDADGHLAALLRDVPTHVEVILAVPSEVMASVSTGPLSTSGASVLLADPEQSLSDRMAAAAAQARGTVLVFVSSDLSPTSGNWLAQLCGYAGVPEVGLVGAKIVDSSKRVRHVGLVRPASEDTVEPAFAAVSGDRAGTLYLAKTPHECLAVPSDCIALSRAVLERAGGFPTGMEEPAAIGLALSDRVRALGLSVIASADVEMSAESVGASANGVARCDPWYNRNLGSGVHQFVPVPRCPALRRPSAIRLAVVVHNLDREGAQSALLDLIKGLTEAGHVVPFVIAPRDGTLREAFEALDIPVMILPAPARRAGGRRLAQYRTALGESFIAGGAEAVLANTLECHAAVAAAHDLGMAAIWWQHEGGAWHRYFRHLPWSARARAYAAFAQAYRVVQVAEATRRDWLPIATRDNFEVVRHGIPSARFAADKARWSRSDARDFIALEEGDICVLMLGSVSRRKGQADLLHALQAAPLSLAAKVRVIIAGAFVEPDYRVELEALHAKLPTAWRERVTFAGAVDAAPYLAAADIFLCCSRRESAPRAIVEAMAYGLPIISTPVDGIPELVQAKVSGHFYTPGDRKALLRLLVQLSTSCEERVRLGQAGARLLPRINDFDTMTDRFAVLIREAAWAGERTVLNCGEG